MNLDSQFRAVALTIEEQKIYATYTKKDTINMARTPKEKAVDSLLTLWLVDDAFSRKDLKFLSETKLQKLVFLSEKSMIDEREKGFNYYFIKLTHGPFSQELRSNMNKLLQIRYLNDFGLNLTGLAHSVLQDFQDVIERNPVFFQKICRVNDQFAPMPLPQLLRIVYAMPWGRRGSRTIADLSPRTPMLYPMKQHQVREEFDISEKEAEDLLMNFDPKAVKDMLRAMKEMRAGRLLERERIPLKI